MKVIYHSDDYGMTSSVTERIAEAWESGLLDGFSIVANGDAVSEGGRRLRGRQDLDARIAVHLNLFEGPALGPAAETSAIADADGNLNNSFAGLLRRWWLSNAASRRELVEQIEREWRRQIELVRELCSPRPIAALDGHLHMHMLPFLFPSAVALAEEFGIEEIRIVEEPLHLSTELRDSLSASFPVNILKNRILGACVANARLSLRGTHVRATDAFIGVLYTGRMTKSAVLAGVEKCRSQGADSVEILFHIGRASSDEAERWKSRGGEPEFALSPMRDREFAALRELRGGIEIS